MKVIVGGLHHESDTFNPIVTGKKDIRVLRGKELKEYRGENAISGIMETLEENGVEVIPTVFARAVPNGEWDRKCYEELKNEIISIALKEERIDGFCLALHGSMRVKEIGEAEGDILSALHSLFPSVPIVTSLDMHATISKKMLANANAFVGYKTAPHTDERETGRAAARLMLHILKGGQTAMAAVHIPFLVAGEKSETSTEPMVSIMERIRECEKMDHVLSSSLLLGFPWADTEEEGVTVLTVTDGDKSLAATYSMENAVYFWNRREDFVFYNETRLPEEAVSRTLELIKEGRTPVVLSDSGDNPTAGSSQDNTVLLSLLFEDGRLLSMEPPLVYQAFYDPPMLEKAFLAGKGGTIEGKLGAYFDKEKSTPIRVKARVKETVRNWGETYKTDLALINADGIDIILTNEHVGCYEPAMMRALGIEPEKCKVIIVKLGYLEPEIRALSASSFMVLTPGNSDEILERLPYEKLKRPIWPLDKDAAFSLEYI